MILTTNRLVLRPHRLDDLDALEDMDGDGDARRFVGGISDRETTERSLRKAIDEFERDKSWKFAIEMPPHTEMIGWCWLKYLERLVGFEIGYQVARAYWDLGIATEAAERVTAFAFEHAGLNAVHFVIDPANAGSVRVVEKLGAELIGEQAWQCPSGTARIYQKVNAGGD